MPAIYAKANRSTVHQVGGPIPEKVRQHPKRSPPKHPGLSPEAVDRIAVRVMGRLAGQLRRFRIVVRHDGVVLHGYVRSYYAKQLAQEAVMNSTDMPIAENAIEIV